MISNAARPIASNSLVYGYLRVSTHKQVKSMLGLEANSALVEKYYQFKLADLVPWGQMFCDPGVSAGKKRVLQREEGRKLDETLKAGDHVIFPAVSRAFRNMRDAVTTLDAWKERGIKIHFAKEGIEITDAANPIAHFMFYMIASVAELERLMTIERTIDAMAAGKEMGRIYGQPSYGWKFVGSKEHRRKVPDEEMRSVMKLIRHLRENERLSFYRIAIELRKLGFTVRRHKQSREIGHWSERQVARAFRAAKKLELEPSAILLQPVEFGLRSDG